MQVNILVHATGYPIRENNLNEVKMLVNQYNSQDHLKSSKKIANRDKLEGMFEMLVVGLNNDSFHIRIINIIVIKIPLGSCHISNLWGDISNCLLKTNAFVINYC
ncbi:hypothetical protein HanRHA438_Chr16g0767481 [Helianthus annuus]|nr:hypothetical protein HanRHA438_Chr16g0767481 [Helianthus annuus]